MLPEGSERIWQCLDEIADQATMRPIEKLASFPRLGQGCPPVAFLEALAAASIKGYGLLASESVVPV
jgi:hypothetical protein